tara:strand:- start:804 stop:1154 length:351 start_codon:yes stop_codon:yes gene_type:complete
MDEDKFNQDVAFNLSSLMMRELHRLLVKANNHYLNCEWKWCFHTLVCLKNSVIQSFSKEERELLTNIENETNFNTKSMEEKDLLWKQVQKYQELLMDTLENHGWLVKKAESHKLAF